MTSRGELGMPQLALPSPWLCWRAAGYLTNKRDSPVGGALLCLPTRSSGSGPKLRPDELYESKAPRSVDPATRAGCLHRADLLASVSRVKEASDQRAAQPGNKVTKSREADSPGDGPLTESENMRLAGRGHPEGESKNKTPRPSRVKTNGSLKPRVRPLSCVDQVADSRYQERILDLSRQLSMTRLDTTRRGKVAVVSPTRHSGHNAHPRSGNARQASLGSPDSGRGSTSPDIQKGSSPSYVSLGGRPPVFINCGYRPPVGEEEDHFILLPSQKYQECHALRVKTSKSRRSQRHHTAVRTSSTSDLASSADVSPTAPWAYPSVSPGTPRAHTHVSGSGGRPSTGQVWAGKFYQETDLDDVFVPPPTPVKKQIQKASRKRIPTVSSGDEGLPNPPHQLTPAPQVITTLSHPAASHSHQPAPCPHCLTVPLTPPRRTVQVLSTGEPSPDQAIPVNPNYHFIPIVDTSMECDSLVSEVSACRLEHGIQWTGGQIQYLVGTLC